MSSLLTIPPDIRMMLYEDFLGNGSMSIAALRQTCRKVHDEIANATRRARYEEARCAPIFQRDVDVRQLHGCTLAAIEACLPPVEAKHVDVDAWDFMFENAVDSGNWDDIDRLLDMFIYPLSSVLVCHHGETDMRRMLDPPRKPVQVTRPVFDLFVAMVASRGAETIQKYYERMPCKCVKLGFVYSAVEQSLFAVLDALSASIIIDKREVGRLVQAVGKSGNVLMLNYVQDNIIGLDNRMSQFLMTCFTMAGIYDHVNLLEHIIHIERGVIHQYHISGPGSTLYSDAAVELIIGHLTSADWSPDRMVDAAKSGNASVFKRLIALQPDPSSTEWHSAFASFGRHIPNSLYNALTRGAEHMTYFCNLYRDILSNTLLEPVKIGFGGASCITICRAILNLSDIILFSASHMTMLLDHMLTYVNTSPRDLLVDCLWVVLKARRFRMDLAETIISKLSCSLETASLPEAECKSLAAVAVDDDAFDWVCSQFDVTITPEDATSIINSASSMHKNVWRRLLSIGAKVQHGVYLLADSMWLLYNEDDFLPPNDIDHGYLARLCTILIHAGSIKPFKRILKAANCGEAWAKVMLDTLESECKRSGLYRSPGTGCYISSFKFRNSHVRHPLSSRGYMRLYYQACEWFNIIPTDPSNVPFREQVPE